MAIRNERLTKDVVATQNAQASRDLETEQELAQTALERNMFSRLLPLLAPLKHRVAFLVTIEVLLVSTVFLRPWFIGQAIDHGFVRGEAGLTVDQGLVAVMVAGLAGTYVFRCGFAGLSQWIAGSTAIILLSDLRRRVFAHVQTLSVRYFDRTKAGRIVSRADRDVDTLEPLLIQGPPELISAVLRCFGAGILLYSLSPLLFVGVFAIVPILAPTIWLFHRIASKNWARVAERRSRFTSHLVETVNGVRVLQQTGRSWTTSPGRS
jgi:ABC-type multidrug transport system fused ATPase/permease subunit